MHGTSACGVCGASDATYVARVEVGGVTVLTRLRCDRCGELRTLGTAGAVDDDASMRMIAASLAPRVSPHRVPRPVWLALALVAVLAAPAVVWAQVQSVTVLGVGYLAFDLPPGISLPQARSYTYRVYAPSDANVGAIVEATCAVVAGRVTCKIPLSAIPLEPESPIQVAITTALRAADGERESNRVRAPFALALGVPPVDVEIPEAVDQAIHPGPEL